MERIHIGVIGAGAIAPAHCSGIQKHPNATLAAIADVNEGRAQELQNRFSVPKRYATVEDLIADSEIDAVSIGLPTFLHARTAIAALEAGKHVLLDKPFAMNSREAESVVAAADKAGVVFTVGMNQRFTNEAQTAKAIIARGDAGELYHAEAAWCRRTGAPRFGTWFGDKSRAGGGTLLDIGVHVLDLTLYLLGEFKPVSVSGATYTKFGNRGLGEGGWGKSDPEERIFDVDDFAAALIKLESGASVALKTSWARHQFDANIHGVDLYGTEAGVSTFPPRIARYGATQGEYETVDIKGLDLRFPQMDRMYNWIDAILGKDELACKPEESLAVQRIIDGIYASAETGREVTIADAS